MIEVELKARLRDPAAVRARLAELAPAERATYRDTYHDDGELEPVGRELRVRVVRSDHGDHGLLTYKDTPTHASGSKPEHEVIFDPDDAGAMSRILRDLGFEPAIELTKWCTNHRIKFGGRAVLATVVEVPELDGVFLEVETLAAESEVDAALGVVRQVLADLGVDEDELTTDAYTDAVRASRGQ